MLISNPKRFVVIPKIGESARFVMVHKAQENISEKEERTITTNGTYSIKPSGGFNAMREVEVDVDVKKEGGVEYLQLTPSAITSISNASNGNLSLITLSERIKLDDGGSQLMIITPIMTLLTDSGLSGYKAIAIDFGLKIAQYSGMTTIGDLARKSSIGGTNWYNFLNSLPRLTEEEFHNLNK